MTRKKEDDKKEMTGKKKGITKEGVKACIPMKLAFEQMALRNLLHGALSSQNFSVIFCR